MENVLVFESRFSGKVPVKLEINSYMNNGRLYIGLMETDGEYTDMIRHSGFCQYPLYMFHAEKLRKLKPYGMEVYEQGLEPEMRQRGLDSVINTLRSEKYGILQNHKGMTEYAVPHPDCAFDTSRGMEAGFRIDTEQYSYLLRCNPALGDYNFYCYCYVSESLNRQIKNAGNGIRFIHTSLPVFGKNVDTGPDCNACGRHSGKGQWKQ